MTARRDRHGNRLATCPLCGGPASHHTLRRQRRAQRAVCAACVEREARERTQQALDLWHDGTRIDEIARRAGLSASTITSRLSALRRAGLPIARRVSDGTPRGWRWRDAPPAERVVVPEHPARHHERQVAERARHRVIDAAGDYTELQMAALGELRGLAERIARAERDLTTLRAQRDALLAEARRAYLGPSDLAAAAGLTFARVSRIAAGGKNTN